MARSKEEMEKWQAFTAFILEMINHGHREKVAIGITGALMGAGVRVDGVFEWADIYFKDEIAARFGEVMGPRKGETIH